MEGKKNQGARPVVSREEIAEGLQSLGLGRGDSVLVHGSLSSLGYVPGGAEAVVAALLDVVEDSGNLLVPTLTGTKDDGPDNPPVFDVRRTPCWTGAIPTAVMHHPASVRSLHPTHSVAIIGPDARELAGSHYQAATPCGPGTPYLRLAEEGGYILLIGVGQESNTTLHTVEELAGVPYHLQDQPTTSTVIDCEGRHLQVRGYLHAWGTPRLFEITDPEMRQKGVMTVGQVGQATVRLIQAREMIDLFVTRLKENPSYFCASDS